MYLIDFTTTFVLLMAITYINADQSSYYTDANNQNSCLLLADSDVCVGNGNSAVTTLSKGNVVKSCPSYYIAANFSGYEPSSVFIRRCQCVDKCGPAAYCQQIEANVDFKIEGTNITKVFKIPVDCLCVRDAVKKGDDFRPDY